MLQTLGLLRFAVVLTSFIAFGAHAEHAAASPDHGDAQVWLKKIQSSAQKLSYEGTFVYQQGAQMRTSRITHLMHGRHELEKLEILDGPPREYIRNNEEISCYLPDSKSIQIEKRITHDIFPAILAADPDELARHYELKKGETGRVAGRETQIILLEPKDKLRYGYRLWADKATGLLLRVQTIDTKDDVIEQIAFTDISIGHVSSASVKSSYPDIHGWHVENAVMQDADLSNWTVTDMLPGFKKIREIKRIIADSPSVPGAPPKQRQVSQIVYSDGLAAISIFIEPSTESRTEGTMQQGAMNILGKRLGNFWITVVGEVPAAAIKQVADSIEFKSK